MLAPKLYLIESEETEGLVKIGFTGSRENSTENDVVYERVGKYSEGISHPSTVYETSGAPVFEKYFHTFITQKQKPIEIKFKLTGKVRRPREWFSLPSNISDIFTTAFSKEHPNNLDDVSVDDLPIFLSGALSAIHWHAQNITAPELAEMLARERFSSAFEEMQIPRIDYEQEQGQKHDDSPGNSELEQPSYSLHPNLLQSVGLVEKLKVEIAEMQDLDSSRTVIAIISAIMVIFLLLTGATIAGCIFAILASILNAYWPNLRPFGVAALVDLLEYLKNSAKKSRRRASRDNDRE